MLYSLTEMPSPKKLRNESSSSSSSSESSDNEEIIRLRLALAKAKKKKKKHKKKKHRSHSDEDDSFATETKRKKKKKHRSHSSDESSGRSYDIRKTAEARIKKLQSRLQQHDEKKVSREHHERIHSGSTDQIPAETVSVSNVAYSKQKQTADDDSEKINEKEDLKKNDDDIRIPSASSSMPLKKNDDIRNPSASSSMPFLGGKSNNDERHINDVASVRSDQSLGLKHKGYIHVSKNTMKLPFNQSVEQNKDWEAKVLTNMYMNDGERMIEQFSCPMLSNGYDWKRFLEKEKEPSSNLFVITDNYFDELSKTVNDFFVEQQLKYMKKSINPDSKSAMRNQIICHKQNLSKTADCWIKWYYADVANSLKWKYEGRYAVTSFKHIQEVMKESRCLDDMNKFVGLLYLSFDYIPNWKEDLAEALLVHHSLAMDYTFKKQESMDPSQKKRDSKRAREGKNCIVRLITYCVDNIRKLLNQLGRTQTGFHTTSRRPSNFAKHPKDHTAKLPFWIYNWMRACDTK